MDGVQATMTVTDGKTDGIVRVMDTISGHAPGDPGDGAAVILVMRCDAMLEDAMRCSRCAHIGLKWIKMDQFNSYINHHRSIQNRYQSGCQVDQRRMEGESIPVDGERTGGRTVGRIRQLEFSTDQASFPQAMRRSETE